MHFLLPGTKWSRWPEWPNLVTFISPGEQRTQYEYDQNSLDVVGNREQSVAMP